MPDLHLDADELEQLATDVQRVGSSFEAVELFANTAAQACGHPELAAVLETFATDWNDRREKIVVGIDFLAQAIRGIGTAFEETDGKLSSGLESSGSGGR